jgi:ECF sigma factor
LYTETVRPGSAAALTAPKTINIRTCRIDLSSTERKAEDSGGENRNRICDILPGNFRIGSCDMAPSTPITELLLVWRQGEGAALDELLPLVYAELRRLAHRYVRGERPGATLNTSALVNEMYLRLVDSSRVQWRDRARFFALSEDTVLRDWRLAKGWLLRELTRSHGG